MVTGPAVMICLGSGGVGKTTVSAAHAISGAMEGRRVVVLTIDPAQRLATTLGLKAEAGASLGVGQGLGNEPTLVEGPWPGELWAAMLDPSETMLTLLNEHASPVRAARIAANPLLANIVGSMSGANEYMAAERLFQLHHDQRFDQVVVDTPPSRHAIDFLDSPQRLTRFIDNQLYRVVFAPRRGLLRSVSSATHLVVRLTARLIGAGLVDDVIRLFEDLGELDQGFHQRAQATVALLADDRCGYTLITSPRQEPLRHAEWIGNQLSERGLRLDAVIVNRLCPFGRQTPETTPTGPAATQPTARALAAAPSTTGARSAAPVRAKAPLIAEQTARQRALTENWEQLAALARAEDELIDKLASRLEADLPLLLLNEQLQPLTTIDGLVEMAAALSKPPT